MGNVAIEVRGLGKKFHRHSTTNNRSRYRPLLTESLSNAALAPIRAIRNSGHRNRVINSETDTFWALKDVSFELNHGDVLGVIGSNGAGKSTLLKILSRITPPTEGYAKIYGRVGALLEVGTGFHGELSGRENVYMNGSILGMTQAEVKRKFDEIVEFAELAHAIDTPIKHYSSGMEVRLAFAIAAHLQPEVLIVDEVLAVGDVRFQRKCLGKMSEVANEGRTVLFVSHNMPTVLRLCQKGLLLDHGRIVAAGDVQSVMQAYVKETSSQSGERDLDPDSTRLGLTGEAVIKSIRILDKNGQPASTVNLSEGVRIQMTYQLNIPLIGVQAAFKVINTDGTILLTTGNLDKSTDETAYEVEFAPGLYNAECYVPRECIRDGQYSVEAILNIVRVRFLDVVQQAITFDIFDDEVTLPASKNRPGVIRPLLNWKVERTDQLGMLIVASKSITSIL